MLCCLSRSSHPKVFCKKGVLENFTKFTRKHLCQILFLNKFSGNKLYIKRDLAQVFPSELCEIFKNTFFYRTPPVVATVSLFDFPAGKCKLKVNGRKNQPYLYVEWIRKLTIKTIKSLSCRLLISNSFFIEKLFWNISQE